MVLTAKVEVSAYKIDVGKQKSRSFEEVTIATSITPRYGMVRYGTSTNGHYLKPKTHWNISISHKKL